MRKEQRKQADEIIKLLGRVHEGIKSAITAGQTKSAMELLAQCQESAIELGQAIEETEGEDFVTVSFLENYCEAVYQVYVLAEQGQSMNVNRIYKNLRKALIQVENSVKNDIKIRTEAVFLPYKASMWDSLESVWKAADEDPDCDAYVIPIPYYDRNPDGSFRQEHYEGDLYPDYVPITKYDEYDFEERRPDIVFIHNPYDNNNYVTSVHPFFYSNHLKSFTDKLVYIPYFILEEIEPDNKAAVEGMVSYCVVPGVLNADKVIVQSEKMRQVYINVLMEHTEGGDRNYWEEKILGLGSPKVDKVLSTRKEELEVPKEWLRIIEKPDGSWKKIIFYNTGITGLLNNDEKMLRKMKDVFRVFKENQDEVALLWRPHPLIKATIESMRPQLWEEYEQIVEEYCREGWGIYDDSADMDRAVAVCDGYYGDHSSLVRLCQEAGKPVMIQDVDSINQENNNGYPQIARGFYHDNEFIFSASNFNALFSVSMSTGVVTLIGKFLEERIDIAHLMSDLVEEDNGDIVISPCRAKNTYIYNCYNKNISILRIKELESQTFRIFRSSGNEGIYFIPIYGTICGKLKRNLSSLEYKTDIAKRYQESVGIKYNVFSDSGIFIYNKYIYFATFEHGLLIKADLNMQKIEFIKISDMQRGFYKILGIDNILYMLGYNNEIVEFDLAVEKVTNILKHKKLYMDKGLYRDGFYWNGNCYFVSYMTNKCIKVSLTSKEVQITTLEDEWNIETKNGEVYRFTSIYKEKIAFAVSNMNNLAKIDLRTREPLIVKLVFDENMIGEYLNEEIKKCIADNGIIYENYGFCGVLNILQLIMNKVQIENVKLAGNIIFKECREENYN